MNNFKRISTTDANDLILRQTYLIDIRDQNSFNTGHMDNAINLNDENIESFINEADKKYQQLSIVIMDTQVRTLLNIYLPWAL